MSLSGKLLIGDGATGAVVAVGAPGSRTLGDLLGDAASVARALPAAGGGEVLLFCEDRYLFCAGLLGAWMAGFPVALPPNGLAATLRLFASKSPAFLHDGAGSGGLDLRTLADSPAAGERAAFPIEPERHLVTVYTSGSTGAAQPCRKTGAQILGEASLQIRAFGIGPADRVLATVPAHHIYGLLFSVLVPLLSGAAFVRTTPLLGEAVAEALRLSGATVLVSVPAHLRMLALLDKEELRSLRLLFSSGAPLDAATAARLALLVEGSFEILGSSETGGIATRRAGRGAAWTPLPGVRALEGEGGQLLLDSPFLAPGLPRPHPCADRIARAADGSFVHLGRLDDVVKIAGKRVALSEVEARLREVPGVGDAAVLAVPSQRYGSELRAAVTGTGLDPAALRQALLCHFDATVVPRQVHVLAQLPLLENGKLSTARLLQLTGGGGGEIPAVPLGTSGDRQRFEVPIGADLPWFRGHFDDFPLLPGVVQLELIVAAQIRRSWPELGAVRRLTRVKFRRPIRPGQTLILELTRTAASVSYALLRDAEICSSGTLELEEGGRA